MVKFETTFNSETTKALNKMAMKKNAWLYVFMSLLLIGIGVMCIVEAVNNPEEGSLGYGIFMVSFGVLFFPLILVLTHFLQKNLDKSMTLLSDETRESFLFTEDKIQIETVKADVYLANVSTTYKYLYKIVENKDTFYLYISKMQSHVIQKKYLTEGTYEELLGYFKSNFNTIKGRENRATYCNKKQK